MEASLQAWLCNADEMIGGESGEAGERLARVGRHIFGEAAQEQGLAAHVCAYFGLSMGAWMTPEAITEGCLVAAMAEDCEHRADFVRGIMSMGAEDRANLMVTIKGNMERYKEEQEGDDEGEDECDNSMATIPMNEAGEVELDEDGIEGESGEGEEEGEENEAVEEVNIEVAEEEVGVATTSKRARSEVDSSSSSGGGRRCKACLEKDSSLQQLSADLSAALSQARETEIRLKSEIAAEKTKLVDAELQVIEREEQLSARDHELSEGRKRIQELKAALQAHTTAAQELATLQDELDVLRPRAERADAAEAQIERLRSRLEELVDVKQQLRTEASAHSETYNRLIAAEQEVAALVKTRAQLEEYRAQCAESTLLVGELERRLQQRDEDLQRTRQDNEALGATSQGSLLQTRHIMEELRETAEQLRHIERGNGIGEGMSELNPALMQELSKLRKDNAELGAQLSASSLESLARLEKSLADQRCMVSSLQTKLLDTKDALAAALQTVLQLNHKINRLEQEERDARREADEAATMDGEDRGTAVLARATAERISRKRHADSIALAVQGQRAVTAQLSCDLDGTTATLESTAAQLAELTSQKSQLDTAHEEKLQQLAQARLDHDDLVQRHDRHVAEQSEAHAAALGSQADRYRDLEVDLEEERTKRRKVEREKKYYEAEAKSTKSQLMLSGGSGGASGQEIEAALKEIKSMQQSLDAAHSEIQGLRAQLSSGGAGDTTEAAASASSSSSSSSSTSSSVRGAQRPQRVKTGADRDAATSAAAATSFTSFFEQSGLTDKRLEQADRERRQLIASNLEESRERMELQQRLLKSDKEIAALKRANTKLTLEKERLLSKAGLDKENDSPNSPLPAH